MAFMGVAVLHEVLGAGCGYALLLFQLSSATSI